MQEAIEAANMRAPDWPVKAPKPKPTVASEPERADEDESEIPF